MNSAQTLHARTKAYARDHSWRSWWCILSTAVLLVVALAGTLPVFPMLLRMGASLLAGLLSLRLFVIYHDQQHRAILPRSRLAELFMRLFGIWSLSPSSIWRSSHDHHHAHNSKLRGSHIGSYPIMTREQYQKSTRGVRFKYLFMRHPLTILFGYIFVFHFGMIINPFLNSPRKHYDCLLALLLHLGLAVVLVCLFGWLTWVLALEFPLFLAAPSAAIFFTRSIISPMFPSTTRAAGPLKRPRSNPPAI